MTAHAVQRGSLLALAATLALLASPVVTSRAALLAQHAPATGPSEARGLPVAVRRIPRGVTLQEDDMRAGTPGDDARSRVGSRPAQHGWITRRVVQPGEPLQEPAVVPPPVVRAGTPVRFEVLHDGFQLAFDGRAVAAASIGDTVAVRLGPKRRLIGVVAGPARVVALSPRRIP